MSTETITLTYGRTTYTVERLTDRPEVPYRLTGPRGAEYVLMRNKPKPHMLFMLNAKAARNTPFEWVRESPDGTLTIVR